MPGNTSMFKSTYCALRAVVFARCHHSDNLSYVQDALELLPGLAGQLRGGFVTPGVDSKHKFSVHEEGARSDTVLPHL